MVDNLEITKQSKQLFKATLKKLLKLCGSRLGPATIELQKMISHAKEGTTPKSMEAPFDRKEIDRIYTETVRKKPI